MPKRTVHFATVKQPRAQSPWPDHKNTPARRDDVRGCCTLPTDWARPHAGCCANLRSDQLQLPHTEVRGCYCAVNAACGVGRLCEKNSPFSYFGRDINDAKWTELMKERGHSSSSVRSMSSQSLDTAAPGAMGS